MSDLVTAKDLTVRYGGQTALAHVDFHIAPGEIVTIVGPNGSGKTTLLRAILGAIPVTAGRIVRAPNLRIGYVPQRPCPAPGAAERGTAARAGAA